MPATMPHSGLSPRIFTPKVWGKFPIELWAVGLQGFLFQDDFRNFSQHISAQNVQQYASYIDTGVTIKQNTDEFGVLEVAGNDADNDEGSITTGGNSGNMLRIDSDGLKATVFECRIKKASIADNALAVFVGLAEEGLAAADTLVDNTGALADKDFIGFSTLHAAGETVAFVHRKDGQALQTVIADCATLVADTYVNLAFVINPDWEPSKRGRIYVDGTEQSTYLTQTMIEAATFPDDEGLAPLFATKVGAAAESKAQLDWWAVGQAD